MINLSLNSSNFQELDIIKTAEPQSVKIECVNTTHETIDHIISLLKDYGAAVYDLKLELVFPSDPYNHDLTGFDFVTTCPNLENLHLKRCDVNESVIQHPKLKKLILKELWLNTNSDVRIGVEENSILDFFELWDCNWCDQGRNSISELTIGSKSALKHFEYSLDEDYAECLAEYITINSCSELEDIYISLHLNWSISFTGIIPKLKKIVTHSGRYGAYNLDFSEVKDGSSSYLTDLRDGKGPYAGEVYVFMGEYAHFDQNKVKSIIKVLGGKVQNVIDDSVTHVCLFGDLSQEWMSEDLSSEALLSIKSMIDGGKEIEVIDEDYASEYFGDWY
jgi:hypothetical protein